MLIVLLLHHMYLSLIMISHQTRCQNISYDRVLANVSISIFFKVSPVANGDSSLEPSPKKPRIETENGKLGNGILTFHSVPLVLNVCMCFCLKSSPPMYPFIYLLENIGFVQIQNIEGKLWACTIMKCVNVYLAVEVCLFLKLSFCQISISLIKVCCYQ